MTSIAPSVAPDRQPVPLAALLLGGAVVAGVVAGSLVTSGRPVLVLALVILLVPLVLWHKPALGPALVVGAALTIEQFPQLAGIHRIAFTARVPLFHGLGGYRLSDVLLGLLLAIVVARKGEKVVAELPRSSLAHAIYILFATVVLAVLLGVGTGGIARVALNEARPFLYLTGAFVVSAMLITTRQAVRSVLWVLVIGSGIKATQGIIVFLSVRDVVPRPDAAVLGHEESLFFTLFILLTLALWLYDVRGALRTTATVLFPVVLAADLGNSRRSAWILLAVGVVVALGVGTASLPSRRRVLGWLAIALVLLSALYFPTYWNRTGGFAQPARAIHSLISPGAVDLSSNVYRVQEDANLRYNIELAGPLGKGFGHPIDYALPIEDLSDIDPYIAYVPHNGVWYLFLRLGVLGSTAFWATLGLGIIASCRLARSRDRELAVVGMLLACAIPAYALLGHIDQGFYFYRVAFVMGALLGLGEAACRLTRDTPATTAAGVVQPRDAT